MMDAEHMDRYGTVRLLSAILANQPRLTGAACIGRHELFDPIRGNGDPRFQRQEQIRRVTAARICAGCPRGPSLPRCDHHRHGSRVIFGDTIPDVTARTSA